MSHDDKAGQKSSNLHPETCPILGRDDQGSHTLALAHDIGPSSFRVERDTHNDQVADLGGRKR
jgi:hypothetical protein